MKAKHPSGVFRINIFQVGVCVLFFLVLTCIYLQSGHITVSLREDNVSSRELEFIPEVPKAPPCERDVSHTPETPTNNPFLIIGIPTVPRSKLKPQDHFLHRTLLSLDEQLSKPLLLKIKVIIYNVQLEGSHDVFENLREKYADRPYFEFLKREDSDKDPIGKKDHGSANKPGWKIRKQSRDLVSMMRRLAGRGDHFMFMEDDWETCNQGMQTITYAVQKVYLRDPSWIMIRFSSGMNSILLKDQDILPFANYLESRHTERPPDHIVVEWYAGEKPESAKYRGSRQHFTFRYLLFHHIGGTSSLSSGNVQHQHDIIRDHDDCWRTIDYMFEVDRYYPKKCPHDDIYPCDGFESDPTFLYLERNPAAPSEKFDRKD